MKVFFLLFFQFILLLSSAFASEEDFASQFAKVEPILKEYCHGCHNAEKKKGSLDFTIFNSFESIYRNRKAWNNVVEQVMNGEMPPRKKKQPSEAEKKTLITWIEEKTQNIDCSKVADPGHIVIHRLNRSEYDHTIRDLTGIDFKLAQNFPVQGGGGEGFDNNSEVMFFPAIYMEKYMEAAQKVADHAKVSYSRAIEFSASSQSAKNPTQYKTDAQFDYNAFFSDWRLNKKKPDWKQEIDHYGFETMKMLVQRPEINKFDDRLIGYAKERNLEPGYLENFRGYLANLKHEKNPWAYWTMQSWIEKRLAKAELNDASIQALAAEFAERTKYVIKYQFKTAPSIKQEIKFKNAKEITFSIGDAGDGAEHDYAIIHHGEIFLEGGKVVPISDLKLLSHQGEGEPAFLKRADGSDMKINSKQKDKVKNGIEVKVPAQLTFALPEKAKKYIGYMTVSDLSQGKGMIQAVVDTEKRAFPMPRGSEGVLVSGPGNALSVQQPHMVWIGNYITKRVFSYTDDSIRKVLSEAEKKVLEAKKVEKDLAYRYPESELQKLLKEHPNMPLAKWPEKKRKKYESSRTRLDKVLADLNQKVIQHLFDFSEKAYRRSVSLEEFEPLKQLYLSAMKSEDNFQKAARLVIQKILMSPAFLYRYEAEIQSAEPMPVSDFELANRMSYFVWSSMPDERLLSLAKSGELQNEKVLEAEVRRMLKDPKAESLSKEFAAQWLGLRSLKGERRPNGDIFKAYNDVIRDQMIHEAHLHFMEMVSENKSVLSLIDSKSTFLNESLAKYYHIPGIKGDEFRKVDVAKYRGGGLLGLGAVHVSTSYPDRTSPILRGLWILETILGNPTPPAPEDVEVNEATMHDPNLTMKERFAVHRENPTCAICHDRIDPIGFTMESFDAAGRFRTQDGKHPVDDLGELKHGKKIKGIQGLSEYILKEKKEAYLEHFSHKLLGFALGRSLDYYDDCVIDTMLENTREKGVRFQDLVVEVVKSLPFRFRRGSLKTAHAH